MLTQVLSQLALPSPRARANFNQAAATAKKVREFEEKFLTETRPQEKYPEGFYLDIYTQDDVPFAVKNTEHER